MMNLSEIKKVDLCSIIAHFGGEVDEKTINSRSPKIKFKNEWLICTQNEKTGDWVYFFPSTPKTTALSLILSKKIYVIIAFPKFAI
ncbi:hypothetical protein [Campylobacter geochelonis]|uniref:hypothetical protein n=1 Tax=Campylobacter geochelonis TaxID=1780362 RepID=UPI00094C739D|nr:hypothetical protein [Campylobacter geochelonis]